jgi:hypothetical protein
MFVEIVTESETYHIYKTVLLTIKVAARDASEARNGTQRTNEQNNQQHNTAKLDIELLLLESA